MTMTDSTFYHHSVIDNKEKANAMSNSRDTSNKQKSSISWIASKIKNGCNSRNASYSRNSNDSIDASKSMNASDSKKPAAPGQP
jgi:hypothetical protein